MEVRFWGVRGSVPVSGPEFRAVGGNTTCVEVTHEGERLILDGGTGLAALGRALGPWPSRGTVLFTHVHWDHIQGVPFFTPLFHPDSQYTFAGARGLHRALDRQMRPPQFPIGLDTFGAALSFLELDPRIPLRVGPFAIRAIPMDHPDGVLVYRIEAGGKTVVFATDVEHGEQLDAKLVAASAEADLLIHDAQYTLDEYEGRSGPSRRGWGHSAWEQAVQTARSAGAGQLTLFHHDPSRADSGVERLTRAAQQEMAGVLAATEGMVLAL